jgi:putative photosynthetic complex assembly protein 2
MSYLLPILFVALLWWASTVLLLHRTLLPSTTYLRTLAGTSVLAVAGFAAVILTRDTATPLAAGIAFSGALAVWALLEASYLLGFVTGPRAHACPPGVSGFERFGYGVRASLYHELSLVAAAALLGILVLGAANTVAFWAFVALWFMRWSTKLNIFLGVRNLHGEFWPSHLQYLKSYARERPMNSLFPWSLLLIIAACALCLVDAIAAGNGFTRTSSVLLGSILLLGLAEHLFLMLRISDDLLWRPATRSRRGAG